MTKFIGVVSGKGGVGKTTVAINLATALTYAGRDIVLLDANLSNANVSLYLGAPNVQKTLHDALLGKVDVKDAAYLHPSGIKTIPGSLVVENSTSAMMRNLPDVLASLDGTAEAVIIDSTAGSTDDLKEFLKAVDMVVVVSHPELPSVTDALKTIQAAEDLGCEVVGVVLNQVKGKPFEMSSANVEVFLGKPLIGLIPFDESVAESVALRHPVVYSHPDALASEGFKELAANLIG